MKIPVELYFEQAKLAAKYNDLVRALNYILGKEKYKKYICDLLPSKSENRILQQNISSIKKIHPVNLVYDSRAIR